MVQIPIDEISPNDYNPNRTALTEMRLLLKSIERDGYTQPVVLARVNGRLVIVDGYHRYLTMKLNKHIGEPRGWKLPCVILEKEEKDRIASTIRHNRARGKHAIADMAGIVFRMLSSGVADNEIMEELGMTEEELNRLKHTTGFSKLFENCEYSKSWESSSQIKHRFNPKKRL